MKFFIKEIKPFETGQFEIVLGGYGKPEELAALLLKTAVNDNTIDVDTGDIIKDVDDPDAEK